MSEEINEQLIRSDSRLVTQIRPIHTMQGLLSRSDGSSQFYFGDKLGVICGVNGPMEVKYKDEKLDRATIQVEFKPLAGRGGIIEKYQEKFIKDVAENSIMTSLHPRTLIQLCFQVVAQNGPVVSAAINALNLALLDAGVPMKSIFAAVSCTIDDATGEIILDPTANELENARSSHCFVFENIHEGLISCDSIGNFTEEEYFACYEICQLGAKSILQFMRTAVEKRMS